MTKGIVYMITCLKSNLRYFGSTTQSLNARKSGHVSNPSKRVKLVLENDCYFFLILEHVTYDDIRELREREKVYIINFSCVNKNIPNNSAKQSWKQWAEKNRLKERQRSQRFRDNNPDYYKNYMEIKKNEI
jgi:hypothetical protein